MIKRKQMYLPRCKRTGIRCHRKALIENEAFFKNNLSPQDEMIPDEIKVEHNIPYVANSSRISGYVEER
jgi:hypothetical protein